MTFIFKGFKRTIQFTPAFDKRSPVPAENYGIHGVDLWFILSGERGATYVKIFTNWHLPHISKEWERKGNLLSHDDAQFWYGPQAAQVGYHSPKQINRYEVGHEDCPYIDGTCYSDSSALASERYLEILIAEGEEALWNALEEYYNELFGGK